MNDLVLALTVAAAITKKSESKYSILLFVAMCLSYQFVSEHITNDHLYYVAAAFIDLFIIHLLSKISKPNNTILLLQKICLCFICVNLIGFAVYLTNSKPEIYLFSCNLLYLTALIVAILEDLDYGKLRNYSKSSGFFGFYHQSFKLLCRNKTET